MYVPRLYIESAASAIYAKKSLQPRPVKSVVSAMDNSPLNEEINDLARGVDQAKAAIQRREWQLAIRALTEAQDRIGRLLKEVDRGG